MNKLTTKEFAETSKFSEETWYWWFFKKDWFCYEKVINIYKKFLQTKQNILHITNKWSIRTNETNMNKRI